MGQRWDVHPGIGAGPIRIGMKPNEVREVLGEDQVYEEWMGGNLNDALLYHGLRLHFSECDSREPLPDSILEWIVIHGREEAYLFDRPICDWTRRMIVGELRERGYQVDEHDNGDVEVRKHLWLSFDGSGRLGCVEVEA